MTSARSARAATRDDDVPLSPALDFLRGLWALNHALERLSSRMTRELGVTAQQRLMIRIVGNERGLTASQLAIVLHLDRGTVSTALKRLEAKGLLSRKRDPRDNRRVVLALTKDGRALNRPAPRTVEHVVQRLLEDVPRREISITGRVMARLSTLVEQAADRT
jgi:DNA-binding MarR family transcriptional regulator